MEQEQKKTDADCPDSSNPHELMFLLETLKALEKEESDLQARCSSDCFILQEQIHGLSELIHNVKQVDSCDSIDRSLKDSNERLDSAKKELAGKLRSIVSLKRQIDAVPTEDELIQYDLRSSELNTQIQKKHCQTRKHYDTYNALMEIKELMLKETSLLNSITSQFQNAIASADGRIKLINSLEGISEGIQQKLEKAHRTLELERKACDSLEEKYTAAISEQRRSSSLLKLIQEERAKSERLQSEIL